MIQEAKLDPVLDKRISTRIEMDQTVSYRVKGAFTKWREARIRDFSSQGIRFVAPANGLLLELKFKLSEGQNPVTVDGRLIWLKSNREDSNAQELGIAFIPKKTPTPKKSFTYFLTHNLIPLALSDKFSGGFLIKKAASTDEKNEAFRLVYQEYLKRGYCRENAEKMHSSPFLFQPRSRTFVLKEEGELIGTVSLIPDFVSGLPMESVFSDEIKALRCEGRSLAEVGFLALNTEHFGRARFSLSNLRKLTASFKLFKALFQHARYVSHATDLVISVHPKHETLYRYLQFEPIGSVKSYPGACSKPALPMRLDILKVIRETPKDKGPGLYFLAGEVRRND